MILLDAGTTYSKTYCTQTDSYGLFPTSELKDKERRKRYAFASGHFSAGLTTARRVNELVALSTGALNMIDEEDYCVLDIGSRDIKYVLLKDRKYHGSDWNQSCGAFTGFTIEMLGRYFNLDYSQLKPSSGEIPVTCGVFAMSGIFDRITDGDEVEETVASFVRGVASSAYRFAGRPKRIYLSGGLCENSLFVNSFPVEVVPLGRFVIIEGLRQYSLTVC